MKDPLKDEDVKRRYHELQQNGIRLFDVIDHYARLSPTKTAIIEYETGEKVSYGQLAKASIAFAAKLHSCGVQKGDVIATTLVYLKEHIYLMIGCSRLGAICAPLDPRLKVSEVDDCFAKMRPQGYFFLGPTPKGDFSAIAAEMMKKHSNYCKIWIQFTGESAIPGAQMVKDFAKNIKFVFILHNYITWAVWRAQKRVDKRDPCLIIFTTGSTGNPKPALLCHEAILVQTIGLHCAFGVTPEEVMLVNLPPSHVGGVAEQMWTWFYGGGTIVLMRMFTPEDSLKAIEKYKVTCIGQIPALFAMEWRLPEYDTYDLSSLKFALYGGQSVTKEFLRQLSTMASAIGSGLGLTETAGFCTYTPTPCEIEEISDNLGYESPLYPISIRKPMKDDGSAGDELPAGEVGNICFKGPQTFNGYLNDEAATRRALSTDDILYTGDLGSYTNEGGLVFAAREGFVIKPKGFQVYPPEVEDFLMSRLKDKAVLIAIVGVEHSVFSEQIVCYVAKKPGVENPITIDEVNTASFEMAAYKRPAHVVIVEDDGIPLNRVAKIDYKEVAALAKQEVEKLRAAGGWDVDDRLTVKPREENTE